MEEIKKVRLDKYLWAIRLFRTRSLATAAIDAGKVRQNGDAVKASRTVNVGDEYDIKTEARKWKIVVTGVLETRVKFAEAINYYTDKTPIEVLEAQRSAFSFPSGKRMNKSGRPTKKDRRMLDEHL